MNNAKALTLPLPPSVNRLYGFRGSLRFLTKEAKDWIDHCLWLLKNQPKIKDKKEAFLYVYFYFAKDNRDCDNGLKATLDLLQKAGIVENDRQFKRLYVEVEIDKKKPRMEIKYGEI